MLLQLLELFFAQPALRLGRRRALAALIRSARGLLQHPVHRPARYKAGDPKHEQRDADQRGRDQQQAANEITFHD